MKHNNPVFLFIEEGMPVEWIMGNMGFEVAYDVNGAFDDDDFEYTDNDILEWMPEPPDGFTLVATYDTEIGPVAMFVKPKTMFAKNLLEFGAQEALKMSNSIDLVDPTRPLTAIQVERGKEILRTLRDTDGATP